MELVTAGRFVVSLPVEYGCTVDPLGVKAGVEVYRVNVVSRIRGKFTLTIV